MDCCISGVCDKHNALNQARDWLFTGPDWDAADGANWAREFVKYHGGDEGLMRDWFASAIEAGRQSAQAQRDDA